MICSFINFTSRISYPKIICILEHVKQGRRYFQICFQRLRHKNRFIYANRTEEERKLALDYAEQEVSFHLKAGQSTRYGQVLAWTNVRRFGDIFVSRRDVTAATRKLDPQGVDFRRRDKHQRWVIIM